MINQYPSPLSDLLQDRAATAWPEVRAFAEPPEPSAPLETTRSASTTAQPPFSPIAC